MVSAGPDHGARSATDDVGAFVAGHLAALANRARSSEWPHAV